MGWDMEFKDYYGILGVERGASDDEIRRSYRKLARKYHPDVSKESDAEARMRDVSEAYDVLRDREKRQAYDNLAAGVSPDGGFQPPPGWDEGSSSTGAAPGDEAQFSEFFSSLFGGARRHGPQQDFRARGEDHHAAIEVDLEDALHGATRDISLRSMRMDDQGRPQMSTRTLSVRIPAGVREGQYIRLGGQGMPGYGGGENGDLYLEVRFKPHARYRVEGRDLYMSLPVAPWEAALGAQVERPRPGRGGGVHPRGVGQWPQAAAARPRHTWRSAWRPVSGVGTGAAAGRHRGRQAGLSQDAAGSALQPAPAPGSLNMKKVVIASATVVGKSQPLDANELAHACGAEVEWVARLVEVGIVSAAGDRREEWRFHSLDLRRAREARRLERDFDAGLDAVALILDLSQEVRRLKAQLRALGATRSRRRART